MNVSNTNRIISVESKNGTVHMPIFNHHNSYCFHISVLQRLHSSPTLNNLLKQRYNIQPLQSAWTQNQFSNYNDIVGIFNIPLAIYATLDKNNATEQYVNILFETFENYFTYFEDNYVHNSSKEGYFPEVLIVFYMLPCIWKICNGNEKTLLTIISQLNLDPINIINTSVEINSNFHVIPYLREEYIDIIENLYNEILGFVKKEDIKYTEWCCGTFEMFPNKDKNGGHAVTILKAINNEYYIFDDHKFITPLEDYHNMREGNIYSITIRDIDGANLAIINSILDCKNVSSSKFSARVNRYELNFKDRFENYSHEDILKKCAKNLNGSESNSKIDEAVWNAKNNASGDTSINGFRKDMGDELANKFIRGVIAGTVLKIILIVALLVAIVALVVYIRKNKEYLKTDSRIFKALRRKRNTNIMHRL